MDPPKTGYRRSGPKSYILFESAQAPLHIPYLRSTGQTIYLLTISYLTHHSGKLTIESPPIHQVHQILHQHWCRRLIRTLDQHDEVIKSIKIKNDDFLYLFSVEMEVYLKSGFRFRKSRLCDILTSFDFSWPSWYYRVGDIKLRIL